ncbi:hypothetical protein ABQF35_26770 [Mycobacterium syngnathidarum]
MGQLTSGSAASKKEGIVGIRSNAHFGVKERLLDTVILSVQEALESFDATQYGVSEVRVERQDDDSFVIKFKMASGDAEQADADAETAIEAIKHILNAHFEQGSVRERQRELTLA